MIQRTILILYCASIASACLWVPWHVKKDGYQLNFGYGPIWDGPRYSAEIFRGRNYRAMVAVCEVSVTRVLLELVAITAVFGSLLAVSPLLAIRSRRSKEPAQQNGQVTPGLKCPNCKLINPPAALRCDCGYDFESKTVERSFLTSQQASDPEAWRTKEILKFLGWWYLTVAVFPLGILCAILVASLLLAAARRSWWNRLGPFVGSGILCSIAAMLLFGFRTNGELFVFGTRTDPTALYATGFVAGFLTWAAVQVTRFLSLSRRNSTA
jgi:hypothetical protein